VNRLSPPNILHAGIVVRRIQATEGGHSLSHHGFHLRIVGYIAANRQSLVSALFKRLGRSLDGLLIPVGQHYRNTRLGKSLGRRKT
jgi:hypothetical protein